METTFKQWLADTFGFNADADLAKWETNHIVQFYDRYLHWLSLTKK